MGSFCGLSMVLYNHELTPASKAIPRYLDLAYYASQGGVPFTQSSNLIAALICSLNRKCWPERYGRIETASRAVRGRLRESGFNTVAPEACASSSIITVALPCSMPSQQIGAQLEDAGYLLGYQSNYLLKRNWIQLCLMGEWSQRALDRLPHVLAELCSGR